MSANQQNGYNVATATALSPIDSNLLEALESSRDRISVLRLEQDIIHFLSDNAREALEIPSLNSYQRLLAHKTGDYYHLTHVSDPARQTLLFHKHPWSKVPSLKLCDVQLQTPVRIGGPSTGAHQASQVKIMKRDSTKSPASVPERAATPVASEPSDETGKTKMGKEERYRAARARIFQDLEESPAVERTPSRDSKKKSASRSNSRDARQRPARRRDAENSPGYRATPTVQDLPYDGVGFDSSPQMPVLNPDSVHQRHLQYFQPTLGFGVPVTDIKVGKEIGLWTTGSSSNATPLSMANLATLDAQTSRSSASASPLFASSPIGLAQGSRPVSSRALAPPAASGGNLWGPPLPRTPLSTRNASAMGLNSSASPWTPRSAVAISERESPRDAQIVAADAEEDDDPTNTLRGLALDDKK